MPRLEDLELQIKQTSTNLKGITNMANALSRLSQSSGKTNIAAKSIKELNSAIKGIKTDKASALASVASALARLASTAMSASSISSSIRQVGISINGLTESIDVEKITALASALRDIKTAASSVKGLQAVKNAAMGGGPTAGGVKSLGDSVSNKTETGDAIEQVGENAEEAAPKVDKFRKSLQSVSKAGSGLSKHLGGSMWESLKRRVSDTIKPLANLYNSFKRIAMYRALRTALKEITQGFATGVKHLYAWSGLVGNSFKGTMDSLATSMNYLRNSLGAMVSPLLDALAPAVDALVDKFVDLVNLVNQFFATMTGKTTWRKALKTQKEYADNTDDAAKAQARLNHQLMAFDELNNISVSNPSGRGGRGKNDDVSADDFEELELPDWAQDIKDAIDRGDWAGAGEALADKLNGIIEDWDSYSAGQLLGQKINNVLSFYVSFMDKFDWAELGKKFAGYVNGVFNNIDPQTLGQAMVAHIKAAFEFLANFVPNVDVTNIALAFSTAINELFSDENAVNVGKTIAGVINKGIEFLKTMITGGYIEKRIPGTDKVIREWVDGIDFVQVGYGLFEAIGTAIKNIKWEDLGTVIQSLAGGLVDMFTGAFNYLSEHGDEVISAIGDFFVGLWGEDGSGLVNIIKAVSLIAGFKVLFGTVFGDTGLIASVKSAASGLFAAAGLTNLVFAASIALGFAASAIIDNIKTYGADKGLWMSLSVMTPEMKAYIGVDIEEDSIDTISETLSEVFGILPHDMQVELGIDASSVWNEFASFIDVYGPLLKALGIDVPNVPDKEPTPSPSNWMHQDRENREDNLYGFGEHGAGALDFGSLTIDTSSAETSISALNDALQTTSDKIGVIPPEGTSMGEVLKGAAQLAGGKKGMGFLTEKTINARKKVTALPPSDDDVSKFNDKLALEAGAVKSVGAEAGTTHKAFSNMRPDADQRNAFYRAIKPMNDKVAGLGLTSDENNKKFGKMRPDANQRNAFYRAMNPMTNSVSKVGAAADSSNTSIGDMKPTSKQSKAFADAMLPWKKKVGDVGAEADTANTKVGDIATALDEVSGDYTATVNIGTEGYTDTKDKLDNLAGVTEHTIKFKPIIDKDTTGFMGGSYNTFNFTLKAYAEGGFPSIGSMFVAGEAGPELVGTINGRNAVASGKEITGIGDAIYDTGEAEAALLREQNALLRQLLAKSGNVTLAPNAAAGRWVAQSQAAYARATGG